MKLRATLELLRRAARYSPSVLVGLSGGKDSLATLELCLAAFSHVEAFLMEMVPGLECERGPVAAAARRAHVELHCVPHWHLSHYLKTGVFAPRCRGLGRFRNVRQRDVEALLRKRTGIQWVAYGHRMDDGASRRFYLRKRGVIDWQHLRLAPLYDWRTREVLQFLRAHKISPPPARYGTAGRRVTGFDLTERCLSWLRDNHPKDYQRVLEFFPDAHAVVIRKEMAP